jgi:hypothetical protein
MEPDATANALDLGEHETTGLLPVGFAFERSGTRYDQFDVSSDGFIRFGGTAEGAGRDERLLLGDGGGRLGPGRMTYEVRGSAPRRRLVVSFTGVDASRPAFQLVVHERTGIVDLRGRTATAWASPRFDSSTWSSCRRPARTPRGRSADCSDGRRASLARPAGS